jgi:hypothetical protein
LRHLQQQQQHLLLPHCHLLHLALLYCRQC